MKVIQHKGVLIGNKDLNFGMSLNHVEALLGNLDKIIEDVIKEKKYIRALSSKYELVLSFSDKHELDFIETYTEKNITIDDVSLNLKEKFDILKPKLDKLANDWVSNSVGMQSASLGIGFYVDGFQKEFEGYFEGFSVFPKNYYS